MDEKPFYVVSYRIVVALGGGRGRTRAVAKVLFHFFPRVLSWERRHEGTFLAVFKLGFLLEFLQH